MRIAVLGTGMVGNTIGSKLVKVGHRIMVGSRTTDSEPGPVLNGRQRQRRPARWRRSSGGAIPRLSRDDHTSAAKSAPLLLTQDRCWMARTSFKRPCSTHIGSWIRSLIRDEFAVVGGVGNVDFHRGVPSIRELHERLQRVRGEIQRDAQPSRAPRQRAGTLRVRRSQFVHDPAGGVVVC
jgi:hypothetical protein